MQTNEERPKPGYRGRRFGSRAPSLLARILAVTAAAVLLIGAVAISIVLFAVTLTGLLVFGLYLWWKTRDLREQIRSGSPGGNVIEGEVIRRGQPDETKRS